jgi:transcriptional regulator with XRE-family HTH domain
MKLSSPQVSERNAPQAKARGTRLLKRRLKVGLSQMALSDSTGISKSMISRLENGERIGSFDVWRKLASTLGTTMARLTADG